MKQAVWIVYMTFCLLIFGLPLFHAAKTGKVSNFPEACPAGFAYDAAYGECIPEELPLACPSGYSFDITSWKCIPLEPPSGSAPTTAMLCGDGRILLGRSESGCGVSGALRRLACPSNIPIHVDVAPAVSDALVIPLIGKYGKRYVWCGMKYETEQVYSGGKSHAN